MKQKVITYIKELSIFLLLSGSTILLYNHYSYLWIDTPIQRTSSFYIIELPFALLIPLLFYFSNIQNRVMKYIVPLIPMMMLLLSFDLFYSFLSRSPRFSDFMNFGNVYDFYPLLFVGFLMVVGVIGVLIFKLFVSAYRNMRGSFLASFSIRVLVVFTVVYMIQTPLFQKLHASVFDYVVWSDQRTLKHNGRISNFIFFSNLEKQNYQKIFSSSNHTIDIAQILYPDKIKVKPNIYMVILESFVDPRLFLNIKATPNPLAKELLPYLKDNQFSRIISPVYGGYTAQAEFELLAGIKAYGKVNTIDFNTMRGGAIQSFLTQLKNNDYHAVAMVAAQPFYFNSRVAYRSLGFDRVHYLLKDQNFVKEPNDEHIFDGDLLNYNLKMVKKHLQSSSKPLFNYVIGMYGHLPYSRNLQKRPDAVKIKNSKDDNFHKIANQFYYRTKALAHYLDQLRKLDPNGIIFVAGDHLPPILTQEIRYKYDKYLNIAFLLQGERQVAIDEKRYYEIPWIIWDLLREQNNSRELSEEQMNQLYFEALKQSMEIDS
ncbi:MAG: sulfatase-like hydrolase/transferase [Campylobacterota bacterium]|nr:sulfatase-like hydrolase/transferase [Campylobacterota bacterium]